MTIYLIICAAISVALLVFVAITSKNFLIGVYAATIAFVVLLAVGGFIDLVHDLIVNEEAVTTIEMSAEITNLSISAYDSNATSPTTTYHVSLRLENGMSRVIKVSESQFAALKVGDTITVTVTTTNNTHFPDEEVIKILN